MNKQELTPVQRAERHVTATCPVCLRIVLLDNETGYSGPRVGGFYSCPWCGTELVAIAVNVICEIAPPLETQCAEAAE